MVTLEGTAVHECSGGEIEGVFTDGPSLKDEQTERGCELIRFISGSCS
jgi:hypothetical protein